MADKVSSKKRDKEGNKPLWLSHVFSLFKRGKRKNPYKNLYSFNLETPS